MKPFQTLFVGRRSLALAGLLFGSGLLAITVANPAAWLHAGFETAINGSSNYQHVASQRRTWTPPIAGSEDFWLGTPSLTANTHMMQPATWQAPVAKGDRFTISASTPVSGSAATSATREYEVITIEPLVTTVGLSAARDLTAKQNQFLVICRSTDDSRPDVLKFVVDSTSGLPWVTKPSRTAHAL